MGLEHGLTETSTDTCRLPPGAGRAAVPASPSGGKAAAAVAVGDAVGGVLAGLLLSALGGLVLVAVVLKETPSFWLQAGGYPVELRRAVLGLFYPALVAYGVGVAAVTAVSLRTLRASHPGVPAGLLLAAGNWLLLAAIVIILVWNNVANLLHGLPLHGHPA